MQVSPKAQRVIDLGKLHKLSAFEWSEVLREAVKHVEDKYITDHNPTHADHLRFATARAQANGGINDMQRVVAERAFDRERVA